MGALLKVNTVLHPLYYDPKHPSGYGGIHALYRAAKQRMKSITLKQVREWLKEQRTYTLHKPIRRKFVRRKTVVGGIDHQWQADLADMQSLMKYNSPYRYLLCVIDVFSKYAWVIPIKDKTGKTLVQSFSSILKTRYPKALQTDKGSEFKNKEFQHFLKKQDIHFFTTENPETKASVVERFQRTLKSRMWKYFTHHQTRRFVDILPQLVNAYNHRHHRSIKMAPVDVNENNEAEVALHLYGQKRVPAPLNVMLGDLVRINKTKRTFDKGYLPNWTTELFKVVRIHRTSPPTVKLTDLEDEPILGSFYVSEIQPIKDDGIYDIDTVLARRTRVVDGKKRREVKVHWKGYPSKFDSWIPESHLV